MSTTDFETVSALLGGIECDELEYALDELREAIEEARVRRWYREHPLFGPPVPPEMRPKPLGLAWIDSALQEDYAPGLRNALNTHVAMHAAFVTQAMSHRQRVRRWLRRHRPHLRSPITIGPR